MPNFTRRAIKQSFMELLMEKPLAQISVREIVERCGINRNSFYYHFQDIPALIEELVKEFFDNLIEKYPTISSLSDCFDEAFQYMMLHKKAVLHIWNSLNRDILERDLMRFCDYIVSLYLNTAFQSSVSKRDEKLIIQFFKCELFGAFIDWMANGMPEETAADVHRTLAICDGLSVDIINRCVAFEKKDNKGH